MMRLLGKISVLLLLPMMVPHAMVTAQTPPQPQTIEEVRKEAKAHLGPFYLTPTIALKELGFDSNVFNENGEPRGDFLLNVSPRLQAWVPVARRALVSTSLETDLVWYAKYSSERSIDPVVAARAEVFLRRLTLFADGSLRHSRQRPNLEIDLRSRRLEYSIGGGAALRLTPKFSLSVANHRSVTEYDADAVFLGTRLRETLNRDTGSTTFSARQRLTPLTTLLVELERATHEFPFSSPRDATSLRVTPGVEFRPRALIRGSARIGYRRFSPKDNLAFQGYSGLVADLALAYTLLGSTTLSVTVNRDVNYSFEPLQPYFVNTSSGLSVRRALGPRFDVIVSTDRHRYSYRNLRDGFPEPSALTPVVPRIDQTWNYAGSIGARVSRTTRIGIGASFWQRNSTQSQRDFNSVRFGTNVTYGF